MTTNAAGMAALCLLGTGVDPMRSFGSVDLYWIPLGAGGHVVRMNGKIYEALKAFAEHRRRCALYHTALEVALPDGRFVIEITPIRDDHGRERGVVAEGAVGTTWAGRFRLFRHEIRWWRNGCIPDASEAVSSPVRVTDDLATAQMVLDLVPSVPMLTWGRDELATGDMWNSNSVVSWLLERAGIAADRIRPPAGGRAPGWDAGLVVARRSPQGVALAAPGPDGGRTAGHEGTSAHVGTRERLLGSGA